jgi:hypothetical protein
MSFTTLKPSEPRDFASGAPTTVAPHSTGTLKSDWALGPSRTGASLCEHHSSPAIVGDPPACGGWPSQTLTFTLPLQPKPAADAGCVPMGVIGVAVNGVPIFNALDAAGRDAVAHEVQDRCHGHPQGRGIYHYHGPSDCGPGATENNALVGYALDGFGIYSGHDDNGREITNADLDECHGRTSPVMWNGQRVSIYHYVMTREYPYTVGCYRGNAVSGRMQAMGAANAASAASRQPKRTHINKERP